MKTKQYLFWLICLCSLVTLESCESINSTKPNNEQSQNDKPLSSIIFTQGLDGYAIYRIPTLVISKKGTILCFCEGRKNSASDNGNIDIVLKRSDDNGKTWGANQVLVDAGEDRYGNPVPVILESGRILLVFGWSVASSSMSSKVFVMYSDDDGVTWSPEKEITDQIRIATRSIYMTGPVHGIIKTREPKKGRILIPLYGKTSNSLPVATIYSDDNGETWCHGGSVPYSKGGESTIAELGDGSLMINMRDGDENPFRYQSMSIDAGATWKTPTQTQIIDPICQGSLLTYKLGDARNNTELLFSNPNHTSSRRHGSVKYSKNGGLTWNLMYQYTTDSGNDMYSAYSDLVVINDELIGVAYESGYKYNGGILFKSFRMTDINLPYTGEEK